jgi:TRAP-type uncharacterized transport system substrate-binding protein
MEQCDATLIALSDLSVKKAVLNLPFVHMGVVPAGTYPGHKSDISAPALRALIVAPQETDAATVEHLSKTILEHLPTLRQLHPAFARIDLKVPSEDLEFIPFHAAVSPR